MIPCSERRRWCLRGRRSGTATWRSFRVGMPAATVISIDMPPRGSSRAHMGSRHAGAAAPVGLALSLGRLWGAAVYHGGALPKQDVVTLLSSERGILMTAPIPGIHHVTAIASDPQRNVDFYTSVLGFSEAQTRSTLSVRAASTKSSVR